jgi:hypothetical protein
MVVASQLELAILPDHEYQAGKFLFSMSYYYGRYHSRSSGAAQRRAASDQFSKEIGGIDTEIEKIFLNLSYPKLEEVYRRYGRAHGSSALSYARKTYSSWKSGWVTMSGMVAERLLDLVPAVLDPETRFELVKKVRAAQMPKVYQSVKCESGDWRSKVAPVVAGLLIRSEQAQIPQHVLDRVRWLADGDSTAAQQLLVAAEQEEAALRLQYLEAEFKRIDFLLANIEVKKTVTHTIELPQGSITVRIEPPRKDFWIWLRDLLS